MSISKNGKYLGLDYDRDYFNKIDSHEKAYWLGFIYADGNIHKSCFQICIGDKSHIYKLKKCLKSKHKIVKSGPYRRLCINDGIIPEKLKSLGITERKSLTLTFPCENIVPKEFINSFMLGYFDGDGCIQIYKPRGCKNKKWSFSIISTYEFCKMFQDILIKECDIISTKILKEKRLPKSNVWEMKYCGVYINTVEKIYKFLYKDSPIILARKKRKFEKILKSNYYSKHTSQYFGVSISWKKYIAQIVFDGEYENLGRFDTELEAAKVYDKRARQLYGNDYCRLNF